MCDCIREWETNVSHIRVWFYPLERAANRHLGRAVSVGKSDVASRPGIDSFLRDLLATEAHIAQVREIYRVETGVIHERRYEAGMRDFYFLQSQFKAVQ